MSGLSEQQREKVVKIAIALGAFVLFGLIFMLAIPDR